MKTLAELAALRDKMKDKIALREGLGDKRVVVGMATCGIAAGARPVLSAIVSAIDEAGLSGSITVTQTGCIGICQFEPVVEVYEKDKEKVTYVNMTAQKAQRVIDEHIKNGKIVREFTIGDEK